MTARSLLKAIVKAVFHILVFPFYLLYCLIALVVERDLVFRSLSQLFSLLPDIVGVYARGALYRFCCDDTSSNTSIGFLTTFSHHDTHIGDSVYIGAHCNIGKCSIKQNCLIGSGVHLLSGKAQHDFSDSSKLIKDQQGSFTKIEIAEDCWIGNNSIVMADLGQRTIVAAGAVVTRPTPGFCVVGGNPAKILRKLETSASGDGCHESRAVINLGDHQQ